MTGTRSASQTQQSNDPRTQAGECNVSTKEPKNCRIATKTTNSNFIGP